MVEEVRIHEKSNGLACHIEVRDHFALELIVKIDVNGWDQRMALRSAWTIWIIY